MILRALRYACAARRLAFCVLFALAFIAGGQALYYAERMLP